MDQKEYNKAKREAAKIEKNAVEKGVKMRVATYEKLLKLEKEIEKYEKGRLDRDKKILGFKQAQYKTDADQLNLTQKIEGLSKSMIGNMSKLAGSGDDFSKSLSAAAKSGDEAAIGAGNAFADLLNQVNSGELGESGILSALANTDFGVHEEEVKKLADAMGKTPKMQKIFEVKAKTFAALDKAAGGLLTTIRTMMASTGIGALVAILGYLGMKLFQFVAGTVKATKELRQDLGTSTLESGRLAVNMQAAGAAAKLAGGNFEQGKEAVTGLLDAFRDTRVVTLGTSTAMAKLLANTGLTGAEAGSLLKTMDLMNDASLETNINTLLAKDNMIEAGSLRTANVLKMVANNANSFAMAGAKGADSMIKAAMASERMGVALSKFDSLADSFMDIEKTMMNQARLNSLFQGANIDLSRAMQLSDANDLEGLQSEIGNVLGKIGIENIQTRSQQRALEDIFPGFSFSDMLKMNSGESVTDTVNGSATPPVAKDTLSAANKSNEILTSNHTEQMLLMNKMHAQNDELIKVTKNMGK